MSERSEALATTFQANSAELLALVERCTDAQWRNLTEEEGWTVAAVAHHVANAYAGHINVVNTLAQGQAVPPAPGTNDERNAVHAEQFARAEKGETTQLLRDHAATAVSTIRGLTDTQLDTTGTWAGRELTAGQFIERIFCGHPRGHGVSIRHVVEGK